MKILADQVIELTAIGEHVAAHLAGSAYFRVQVEQTEPMPATPPTPDWGGAVLALEYRAAPSLPWTELDTGDRISASGLFPTGDPHDSAGLPEVRVVVQTVSSTSGARARIVVYADGGSE